jgi:hypothetical protein
MPDTDRYPTNPDLDAIRTFQGEPRAWFDLIKLAWWAVEWGWYEEASPTQTTIFISTGGWSGNESIIDAMKNNTAWLWTMTWASSRRGGHFTFTFSTSTPL